MRLVEKDSVNVSVDVYIIDATARTPELGVVFDTSGMDLEYRREGGAVVNITEVTLAALTTAWAAGGFLEIGHGYYRLDVPDAAFATGAESVSIQGTVTGMIVIPQTIQLTDNVWDVPLTGSSHNVATSSGRRLRQVEEAFIHANGIIATVTDGHTFTLDAGAVATTDYYIGDRLQIVEGTGAGQSRIIVAYTSGKAVTLDSDFTTNPDTASLYEIVAADVHVSVSDADLAEGFVATYTNTTTITLDAGAVATTDYYLGKQIIFTHGTGQGQSREITGYTSGRVVTMSPALTTAIDTTTTYHIALADGAILASAQPNTTSHGGLELEAILRRILAAVDGNFTITGSGTVLTFKYDDDTTTATIHTLTSTTRVVTE